MTQLAVLRLTKKVRESVYYIHYQVKFILESTILLKQNVVYNLMKILLY